MPLVNRKEICAEDEIQAFHLINRCARRTFLCGKDRRLHGLYGFESDSCGNCRDSENQ